MKGRPKLYPMHYTRAVDNSAVTECRLEKSGTGVWLDWLAMRDRSGCDFVDDIGEADAILLFQSIPFNFEWNMKFCGDPSLVWEGGGTSKELRKWLTIQESKLPILYFFTDFNLVMNDPFKRVKRRESIFNAWGMKRMDPNRVFVLHYARDKSGLVREWQSRRDCVRVPKDNFFYADIDAAYWGDKPFRLKTPGNYCPIPVYLGNSRRGERIKFLSKFSPMAIEIVGRWADKWQDKLSDAVFSKQIYQTEVLRTLNGHWGHIVTQDEVAMRCEATCTRLVQTLAAGTLPLIDKRLAYYVPQEFHSLLVDGYDDVLRLQHSYFNREKTIVRYQKYIAEHFRRHDMAKQIPSIIKKALKRTAKINK